MKLSFHYSLYIFFLAIMLFSYAIVSDGFTDSNANTIGEVSDSRLIAEENNGEVDDLLIRHSLLHENLYLSNVLILLQQSDISYLSMLNKARAPPIA